MYNNGMLKNAGLFFTTLGVSTYIADLFSNHALAHAFARMRCGDLYLVEPNSAMHAQGIVSDYACGFDADVSMFVICLTVALSGLSLLLIPMLHPKH